LRERNFAGTAFPPAKEMPEILFRPLPVSSLILAAPEVAQHEPGIHQFAGANSRKLRVIFHSKKI